MSQQSITLRTLRTCDGSATYTTPSSSLSITAGVNYPLEVQYRSKELPESTYIEVSLRPNNAVPSVREHHLESIIARFLASIVLGEATPRCMLQVTLQVVSAQLDESLPGGVKGQPADLELLATSINAAVAACLDAGVQMKTVAGSALVAVQDDQTVLWPKLGLKNVRSMHCLAFGRDGACFLVQSEGNFTFDDLEEAERVAKHEVIGSSGEDDMDIDPSSLLSQFRKAVEESLNSNVRLKAGI